MLGIAVAYFTAISVKEEAPEFQNDWQQLFFKREGLGSSILQ